MDLLLEVGLANAMMAAALAPVAALMSRAAHHPARSHVLWLLVLLVFVTLPIVSVPILPAPERSTAAEPVYEVAAREAPPASNAVPAEPVAEPFPSERPERMEVSWRFLLGWAWLGGSAARLMLAAWRIGRFRRIVRRADEAPDDLRTRVETLSARIGLARPPVVILAPGRLSPMVWALGGRARLIVPVTLWARLDDDQRASLLIHELAHLKRRDHWVRLLELAATGLYWWHPALWWARRELHRAEEACCDLWVVWALPEAKRSYATALVEAVDFLSEARPRSLPVGASGMGQVEDLTRRIGIIMRGDTPRGLSRAGILTAIGLAALLLPWRPTLAQQEPKAEEKKTAPETAPAGDIKPEATTPRIEVQSDMDAATEALTARSFELEARLKNAQAAQARIEEMAKRGVVSQQEVDRARADVLDLKAQIADRIEAISARDRARAEGRREAARRATEEVEVLQSQLRTKQAAVRKAEAQRRLAVAAKARIDRLQEKGVVSIDEKANAEAELAVVEANIAEANAAAAEVEVKLQHARDRAALLERPADRLRRSIDQLDRPADLVERAADRLDRLSDRQDRLSNRLNRPSDLQDRPAATGETKPSPGDPARRLDELESKLDRVLKEIEGLRKGPAPATPPRGAIVRPRTDRALLGLAKRVESGSVSNEEIVKQVYAAVFDREPTADEVKKGVSFLSSSNVDRTDTFRRFVLGLAPTWIEGDASGFALRVSDASNGRTPEQIAEIVYRAILDRAPSKREAERFHAELAFSPNRRESIHRLVVELLELRDEALKIKDDWRVIKR